MLRRHIDPAERHARPPDAEPDLRHRQHQHGAERPPFVGDRLGEGDPVAGPERDLRGFRGSRRRLGLHDGERRLEHAQAQQRLQPGPARIEEGAMHRHRQQARDQGDCQRGQQEQVADVADRAPRHGVDLGRGLAQRDQDQRVDEQRADETARRERMEEFEDPAHVRPLQRTGRSRRSH